HGAVHAASRPAAGDPRSVVHRRQQGGRGVAVLGHVPGEDLRGEGGRGGHHRMTRRCRCDRFHAGRAYVAGGDCAKCWMYAPRPSVRRAWGGDPADCAAHFAARPGMTPEALAEVLAGPEVLMPEGWRRWPATRAAHLLLAQRAVAALPEYP